MSSSEVIKARVEPLLKSQFANLAARRGFTESALLKLLIRDIVVHQVSDVDLAAPVRITAAGVRVERVMVRMRTGDRALLVQRAAVRGLKPATYLAVLARSHLRAVVPLPTAELVALKRSVAELSAVGRNLNLIARVAHHGQVVDAATRVSLQAVLGACEALRSHTKALINANLQSWETGNGQTYR